MSEKYMCPYCGKLYNEFETEWYITHKPNNPNSTGAFGDICKECFESLSSSTLLAEKGVVIESDGRTEDAYTGLRQILKKVIGK